MIVVCEPQCKRFSHEKVNSGFLLGLRLAFPNDAIKIYAHSTHIEALKEIVAHDKIDLGAIEYIKIEFGDSQNLFALPAYYMLFHRIFKDTVSAGVDKIFFLSFSATLLYLIKKLKKKHLFSRLRFTFVLHGEFENIVESVAPTPTMAIPKAGVAQRLRKIRLIDIPGRALGRIAFLIKNIIHKYSTHLSTQYFPLKKILLWQASLDYRYISLSPHITENAKQFIDISVLNISTVVLPTFFSAPSPKPVNDYPKFAIFGYGNSAMLQQVLLALSKREQTKPYEIRIIGMGQLGTEDIPNVTAPIKGRGLTRDEMETYAKDIDAFLILYPKDKYRLCCSGSILEALSYIKPVLHFDNACINYFNDKKHPIGIRCESIDEYVEALENVIENYDGFITQADEFRHNIMLLRNRFCIKQSVPVIGNSFTWD